MARLLTSVAFGLLAWRYRDTERLLDAWMAMALMFLFPTVFFLFSHPFLATHQLCGLSSAFAIPVMLAQSIVAILNLDALEWATYVGTFWLRLLITIVATLAGMSQLHMIAALIEQSSHDLLTGVFNRRSGEILLDLHARQAARRHAPWAVAFFDIDKFKRVNDVYGHDAGDECLKNVAAALSEAARNTDVVIRWGGEEFVLLMSDSSTGKAARPTGAPWSRRQTGTCTKPSSPAAARSSAGSSAPSKPRPIDL